MNGEEEVEINRPMRFKKMACQLNFYDSFFIVDGNLHVQQDFANLHEPPW